MKSVLDTIKDTSIDLHHEHLLELIKYVMGNEGPDKKIACIRTIRDLTGLSLADAKSAYEFVHDTKGNILQYINQEKAARNERQKGMAWVDVDPDKEYQG